MIKKLLIAGGDSWTDANFRSASHPEMDVSWPKWPEILAKHLGMRVINLALSGQDNIETYESIQDAVIKYRDNVGFVAVGWTHANRRSYQSWNPVMQQWQIDNSKYGKFTNHKFETYAKNTVRLYMSLQILCERYNIPYLQSQMMPFYQTQSDESYLKPGKIVKMNNDNDIQNSWRAIYEYDEIINNKRFPGWPPIPELNGWSMMGKYINDDTGMCISLEDGHPNKEGQEKIAQILIEHL